MKLPFRMALERGVELELLTLADAATATSAKRREGAIYAKATVWRDGPNKNHVYLNDGELEQFAQSFVGQPFLRDHSRSQGDRGGTIRDAKLVDAEGGGKAIRMVLEAVKPWAKEGLQDGTVDRFSIGWAASEYRCTVCELDYFDEDHKHSVFDLGRKDKKSGKTVGVRMYGLEGSEVSAVTHPAVPGTGTDEVLESLKVASEQRASARTSIPAFAGGVVNVPEEETGMKELLTLLGLPADTPDAEALAEVKKRISPPPSVPVALLAALGLGATSTPEEAIAKAATLVPREELEKERNKNKAIRIAQVIEKAEREGKLTPAMRTAWADKLAADDPDSAEKVFASLPASVPVAPKPVTADPHPDEELSEADEEARRAGGLSVEQWNEAKRRVEHFKKHGEYPPVERKKEAK